MNTKTNKGGTNKGNPYFLRVPWNKGGLVNTGPGSLSGSSGSRLPGVFVYNIAQKLIDGF